MLTDIFADRYLGRILWEQCTEIETKLLNQCFRIVAEQLIPYWINGKESNSGKERWTSLHDRLSMELGIDELTPRYYSYQTNSMGKPYSHSGFWTMDKVCKNFVCANYDVNTSPDRFLKERLSFIELAFRQREEDIQNLNNEFPTLLMTVQLKDRLQPSQGLRRVPGNQAEGIRACNDSINSSFCSSVNELNERFRRACTPLNYHNGFIQVATDGLTQSEIEKAFWAVVADPLWKNVDIDMKEALDRRDASDRDPAFYAARALESAIKIISDQKGWTHSRENGAHNYIDNLGAAKNGPFIKAWERDALKAFFTEIRNPFGHGPGSAEMPELTITQTNWAIENCMSWIKSLVQRI